MGTFLLIHGAGDVGWSWHLVAARLRARGHAVLAPDLPCEDDGMDLRATADWLLDRVGAPRDLVVVGHSFGGFVAPLVAARVPGASLVYLAAMVPAPGERAADWWADTGYADAVREQAAKDGGLTGSEDPSVAFCNGVACSGGWCPSGSASCRRECPAAIASRSATRPGWPGSWPSRRRWPRPVPCARRGT